MTHRERKLPEAAQIVVALLASLCFGVSYGYTYGIDNQVVYMVGALRIVDPTILKRDWFATQTTHYHLGFKYVAAALIALDRRGWAVAITQTLAITAGMMCLYALLRVIADRRGALASFLLLLAVAFITRTKAANATYVFDILLQPSTLGSVALLAAAPFFAQGRWLASGACIAAAGVFHANYLVLMLMSLVVTHLLLGKAGLLPRLALQLALPSLVLLIFLPLIFGTASSPDSAAAQNVYFNIRAPHHFNPGNAEREYIPFVAWQLIAAGTALHLVRREPSARRLAALIGGVLLAIWSGVVMSTLVHVPKVTQLFAWRLSPHCELLLQALACAGAVEIFLEPGSPRRRSPLAFGLLVAGAGFLAMYSGDHDKPALAALVLSVGAALLLVHLGSAATSALAPASWAPRLARLWRQSGPGLALLAALGAMIPTAVAELGDLPRRSILIAGLDRNEVALYAWMRASTPKDAIFLTPPDAERMRYHGERAIVVDWKSNPLLPSEMLEWYRRLKEVTGRPKFSSGRDLEGYNTLDEARLTALRARYGFDFVVVRRGHEAALSAHPQAYSNAGFVVFDLRGSPAGEPK